MKPKKKKILLDPEALAEYSASLSGCSLDEIRQAKKQYLLDALANFKNIRSASRALLVILAIASIFPPFLIILIPAYFGFRNVDRSTRQRLIAAAEIWKCDLGDDYANVRNAIKKA